MLKIDNRYPMTAILLLMIMLISLFYFSAEAETDASHCRKTTSEAVCESPDYVFVTSVNPGGNDWSHWGNSYWSLFRIDRNTGDVEAILKDRIGKHPDLFICDDRLLVLTETADFEFNIMRKMYVLETFSFEGELVASNQFHTDEFLLDAILTDGKLLLFYAHHIDEWDFDRLDMFDAELMAPVRKYKTSRTICNGDIRPCAICDGDKIFFLEGNALCAYDLDNAEVIQLIDNCSSKYQEEYSFMETYEDVSPVVVDEDCHLDYLVYDGKIFYCKWNDGGIGVYDLTTDTVDNWDGADIQFCQTLEKGVIVCDPRENLYLLESNDEVDWMTHSDSYYYVPYEDIESGAFIGNIKRYSIFQNYPMDIILENGDYLKWSEWYESAGKRDEKSVYPRIDLYRKQ